MNDLDRRKELVAQRLAQQYELHHSSLTIGHHAYQIAQVSNVDKLLDDLIAKGPGDPAFQDEQIPYWADLWHAAIGMVQYLVDTHLVYPHQSILEIGCGIGLPGIAAAKLGADVILSDYLPEALVLAEYVAILNGVSNISFRQMDWRKPIAGLQVDMLLASDVAYEKRTWEPLLAAFRQLVKPGGKIVLSEPGRPITKPWLDSLREEGWQISSSYVPVMFRDIRNQVGVFVLDIPV